MVWRAISFRIVVDVINPEAVDDDDDKDDDNEQEGFVNGKGSVRRYSSKFPIGKLRARFKVCGNGISFDFFRLLLEVVGIPAPSSS